MKRKIFWISFLLLFAILLIVIIPLFVPVDHFRPEIESRLSRITGRQVHIGHLDLSFFPPVTLVASEIQVKGQKEEGNFSIGHFKIRVDMSGLFEKQLRIREIRISEVEAPLPFLTSLAGMRGAESPDREKNQWLKINRIVVEPLTLVTGKGKRLGPYELKMIHKIKKRIYLNRKDGAFGLEATLDGDAYKINIYGNKWTLPLGPPVIFESLSSKILLDSSGLKITDLSAKTMGGNLSGTAKCFWGEKWRVDAWLEARDLDLEQIMKLLGKDYLTGRVTFNGKVSLDAAKPESLLEDPRISGELMFDDLFIKPELLGTLFKKRKWSFTKKGKDSSGFKGIKAAKVKLHGSFSEDKLVLKKMEIKISEGVIRGNLSTTLNKNPSFESNWRIKGINLEKFLLPVGIGGIGGKLYFTGDIARKSSLGQGLNLDGELFIKKGFISKSTFSVPKKGVTDIERNIAFESLVAKGVVDGKKIALSKIDFNGMGGRIIGTLDGTYGKGWSAKSNLTIENIDLGMVFAIFNKKTIGGNLFFTGEVAASDPGRGKITDKTSIKGDFLVNKRSLGQGLNLEGELLIKKGFISKSIFSVPKKGVTDKERNITFESLVAKGVVDGKKIALAKIDFNGMGGQIIGTLDGTYGKGWSAKSNLTIENIDLGKVFAIFNKKTIGGNLFFTGEVAASDPGRGKITDKTSIKGDFLINNGTIYKIDLKKAATSITGSDTAGDNTQFKKLQGQLNYENNQIEVTDLEIDAGLLEGKGHLHVSNYKELNGELTVGLRSISSLVGLPLKISGTVDKPFVRPTTETLGAAAVGTLILGPGVGTVIGIKVGQGLKKLKKMLEKKKN